MAGYESIFEDGASPYISDETTRALRRRSQAVAQPGTAELVDPNKGNWGAETTRSTIANFNNDLTNGVEFLGRGLVGDEEGRMEAAREYQAEQQRAREMGPAIQSFDDAEAAGGDFGDYGAALAYQAAGLVPDVATTLTGIGLGATAARQGAKRIARRSIADAIESRADNVAARIDDTRIARDQARQFAVASPDGAKAVSNAVRVAQAQVDETARKAAMKEAAIISGRTPRTGRNPFQRRADRAGTIGGRAAGTAASIPTLNGSMNAEKAADADTTTADMWKLAAGTTAAAATQVIPLERFLGQFGKEAMDRVARKGTRLLPQMVKEFGKQGLAEGTQETAQQALQLASHAWVEENLDRLTDSDAIDQYIASFAAGGLIGGGLGAGGAASRGAARAAAGAGQKALAGARWTRDKVKAGLASYAERARKARARPGEAVDAAGAPAGAAGGSPRDLLRRGVDAARGVGEAVVAAGQSAADRFRGFKDDVDFDDALDARIDAVYDAWEKGGAPQILGERRFASQNPVALEDPLQAHLMSYVRADSPVWGMSEARNKVAKALNRLFTGKPTHDDLNALEALVESGSLARETMDSMAIVGPQWGVLHKMTRRAGAGDTEDGDASNQVGVRKTASEIADEQAALAASGADRSEVEAAGDLVNDALDDRKGNPDAVRLTPAERAATLEVGTPEHTAAVDELRSDLLGPKSEKYKFGSNVVYQSTKDPAPFRALMKKGGASRIEIDPVDVSHKKDGSIMAPAALSIDSLVTRYVNQIDDFDTSTPEGEQQRAKAALLRVFADLTAAGIKIKPESITSGPLGNGGYAKNGTYIGRISPRDAAELRASVALAAKNPGAAQPRVNTTRGASKIAKVRADAGAEALARLNESREKYGKTPADRKPIEARDPSILEERRRAPLEQLDGTVENPERMRVESVSVGPPAPLRPNSRTASQGDAESRDPPRGKARGEDGVDSGGTDRDRVLAPRPRPSGAKGADGAFVSTNSNIESVTGDDKLGEVALKARKEAADLGLVDDGNTGEVSPRGRGVARVVFKDAQGRRLKAPVQEKKVKGGVSDPRFKAGIQIGMQVLEGERDTGAISERRFNVQVQRLQNIESGLAKKYYTDALAGKYVKAAVTEVKADKAYDKRGNPVIDTKALRKEQHAFADDVDAIANADEGGHDTARESDMLNAILEAMGIKHRVHVRASSKIRGGHYTPGPNSIRISPSLVGAERIEVLAHELGHHIVFAEIADAAGVPIGEIPAGVDATSTRQRFDLLKKHNPELHAALMADFTEWKKANPRSQQARVTRASRAPLFRAETALTRSRYGSTTGDALASDDAKTLYLFDEYLADQIARALTTRKQGRSIIQKFFGDIADALRAAYRAMFPTDRKEWAPAPSVDAWVKSLFDRNTMAVKALGVTVPAKPAKKAVRAAATDRAPAGAVEFTRGNVGDLMTFIKYTLPREERGILDRVFNRPASNLLLRKHWADFPDFVALLDDAKEGMESRIALGYLAWREGAFKTGPDGRQAFKRLQDDLAVLAGASAEGDLAQRVLEDVANGTVQHFHDKSKTYSVRDLEARARGPAQRALNWVSQQGPISDAMARFWTGTYSRMADSGLPAMRALGAMMQRPHGATGDDDRGLIPAVRNASFRFHRKVNDALKDLDPGQRVRALSVLQRAGKAGDAIYDGKAPKVRAAVDALRAVMDEAHAYMVEAGAIKKDVKRSNFFPVLMDLNADGAREALTKLYNQPKFEEAIRKHLGDAKAPMEDLVKRLVDFAARDADTFDPFPTQGDPGFRHKNFRISQFVYDLGDAADVRAFAKLQTKNIDEVFARYFSPMVKFAEYKRREAAIKAQVEDITKQGGDEKDVALAKNAVRAAMGTYGMDGSPTLAALSPALAKKFSGPKTKAFVQGAQSYENLRLLPLAIMSSLVDPMGIAVRTGGGFKETWEGFRTGVRSLTNKKDAREMLAALEDIGLADDFLPAIASHPTFDGGDAGLPRRINEAVFKWNGMNAWVRATRVMALHAGHRFLLKHAAAESDDSKRYLAELGLDPKDIVAAEAPGQVVINDKTRAALQQFVDEAILRPNAMQAPLWHRDPYMGMITQYKAFAYAIYDQISGRIFREMNHGNFRVLLAAMSYLPIILMAELLRELIQHGTDGNPNRKDWGPGDYAQLATERSGLLGPRVDITSNAIEDVQRNRLPTASLSGPALQQAGNVVKAVEGRRDRSKEIESALPGSALYKNWNDTGTEEAA